MKLLTIILTLTLSLNCLSQDFDKIGHYVNTLNLDKNISIEQLIIKLTEPYELQGDKVAIIYYWIAQNIAYDYEGFENDYWTFYQSDTKLIEDTYDFKKGVCSGYAHLFNYMLDLVGIKSVIITGYARTGLETFNLTETNHEWNAVNINSKWFLIDVTWSRDTLTNKIREFYFKTSPDLFILNHYPEKSEWTLLNDDYSFEDFLNFPIYTTSFHDIGFTKELSKKGLLEAVQDTVSINLSPTKDYLVLVKLFDFKKQEWFSPEYWDRTKKEGKIKFYLDSKGDFILKIAAILQGGGSITVYDNLIFYRIKNE